MKHGRGRGSMYVPKRGDLIWLSFTPQAGHEQSGRRPAVVLSPRSYNSKAGLMLACPVTSQSKGYPFEVAIPVDFRISGVILSDQIKSLDWKAREAELIASLPPIVVNELLAKAATLLQPE
jgi:mRNA interferase MazF